MTAYGCPSSARLPAGNTFLFLVVYLAGLSAFGSFVNDMFLPALPSMTRFFNCSVTMARPGLTTGMIGLGLGELLLGPVSDRYGRKPVLVASLVAFCPAAVSPIVGLGNILHSTAITLAVVAAIVLATAIRANTAATAPEANLGKM